MPLIYANGKTREEAAASVAAAEHVPGGAYTLAQAWDDQAHRWAYPDKVLEDLGMSVLLFGDTGGHGFAISSGGLYLSSNGHAHKVENLNQAYDELRARGFIGKRLGVKS